MQDIRDRLDALMDKGEGAEVEFKSGWGGLRKDKIVSGWRYLGWPVPVVTEETRPDYVVLTMPVGISGKKAPTRKTHKKTPQER